MTKKEPHIFKFMSVDGKTFHLRCRSAFDALLDGSFLGFLALCVTLFIVISLLTFALDDSSGTMLSSPWLLPATAMYLAITMSGILSLMWILSLIFHRLAKWGLMPIIFTPLFYVIPVAVYGIGVWVLGGIEFNARSLAMTAMFLTVCACFDILYGHFVAPHHSKYIGQDDIAALSSQPEVPLEQTTGAVEEPISLNESSEQPKSTATPHTLASESAAAKTTEESPLDPSEGRPRINIRKQSFLRDEIRWIQSEDHYLNVHLASESVLLLGKLSEAVAQLPEELGVQINRSVWVAHDAIQSIDALNSRKMFLTLTTGEKLKVTKTGRELLKKSSAARANG